MPVHSEFYISCVGCGTWSENPGVTDDEAKENAALDGWQVDGVADLCPSCTDTARGATADEAAGRQW